MTEHTVKRTFNSQLGTGIASFVLCFILACILWPIWSLIMKSIFSSLAATGLAAVEPGTAGELMGVMVEGSFFWMVINPWIWMTIIMGNYGKTHYTTKQPHAGLWYSVVALIAGLLAFFVIIGFIGIWWKPFNLALLLTPKTAAEVELAIMGWGAANFLALPVIMTQIPFAALFHKWPFAGTSKQPTEGWGVFFFSTLAVVIVWIATVIPHFIPFSVNGQSVVNPPMGSWATWVAFCQAFIFVFLIPAEGGEGYPMKLFTQKQPYMGIVGFVIALAAGLIVPPIVRGIIAPLDLLPGAPVDLAVASIILTGVISMLFWHHLFDDYPSAQLVPNTAARVLIRLAIWVVLGAVLGVIWLKIFTIVPFGANNLGMGYPTMGVLAGQFAFLMTLLFYNTFFDKWPLVYKERVRVGYKETVANLKEDLP